MLEVKKIDDKKRWNNFLLNQPTQTGIFLQSAEWLDFQEAMGRKTWRLAAVDEQENITALCGTIEHTVRLGKKYFYIPHGPIGESEKLINEVIKIARQENAIFYRIEPTEKLQATSYKLQETSPVQPKHTLVLDLNKSEEDLLSAMHEKTRYNIRLAEKKNLSLIDGAEAKIKFENFWKLMEETTKRDKFRPHQKKYYQTILEKISGDGKKEMRAEIKIVYCGDKPVAAAIVGYFGDTVTYLHGASSNEYRNLMAPYFLHWEIIKNAKQAGCRYYDFWGIDETKWPGVTRFKKGFGGFEINYPGAFDLPLSKTWYTIYNLAKKLL
jgi:lipid II:glycine glycyltransferase (peptidoglycan interpeptide bridge formation enzyme)